MLKSSDRLITWQNNRSQEKKKKLNITSIVKKQSYSGLYNISK